MKGPCTTHTRKQNEGTSRYPDEAMRTALERRRTLLMRARLQQRGRLLPKISPQWRHKFWPRFPLPYFFPPLELGHIAMLAPPPPLFLENTRQHSAAWLPCLYQRSGRTAPSLSARRAPGLPPILDDFLPSFFPAACTLRDVQRRCPVAYLRGWFGYVSCPFLCSIAFSSVPFWSFWPGGSVYRATFYWWNERLCLV